MALEVRFIGVGWGFPPLFEAGGVRLTGGVRNIEESLRIITGTQLGERLMRPNFGCGLDDEIFGQMNSNRLTWIENLIRRAILLHEPRIDAETIRVEADQPEGRLLIRIAYTVRGANSRFNFVFPFYLGDR
ncbi:GPW/gp25 family protein [Pikeienuella piscinae]|uniref:GPW/gp25 family protein n=1 Tax=Pikeienuella piscinae TaxID=2748098 RepID=A0A7L5BZU3_9RHOB|nr:GPW/gp25 family protein [Pikeienuella piscinae]QIE56037.1 GPW/gp25 family protein [Pikeienuella piscinae]